MQAGRYYKHSGITPPRGLLLSLAAVLLGAALGPVYAYLVYYSPLIYINILATIACGVGVGMLAGRVAKHMKVRNGAAVALVSLVGATLFLYTSWVAWIRAVSGGELLVLAPTTLLQVAQELAINGVWSFKGTNVSGWALYSVWLGEAALLMFFAVSSGKDEMQHPFCEKCERWLESQVSLPPLYALQDGGKKLKQGLEMADYRALDELRPVPSEEVNDQFTTAHYHSCSGCNQLHLLTVNHVKTTTDKKGEVSTAVKPLIQGVYLDPKAVARLQELEKAELKPPALSPE